MSETYEFVFEKNIHMYNHRLTVTSAGGSYSAIIEDSSYGNNAVIVWLEDFALPESQLHTVRSQMRKWFAEQGYVCLFETGKRVTPPYGR